MQKLFKYFAILTLFLPVAVHSFTVPQKPAGSVEDYANMLTSDQVSMLEARLEAFTASTTDQIAVVAIPSLDGDTIENVAQNIFTQWGIGQKDKNNGVLLLISLADRQTRIQTGYGVEGDLTDVAASYIQRDIMTPAFRQGDYYGGIDGAVNAIETSLSGSDIVPASYSSDSSNNSGIGWQFIFVIVFIGFQWLVAILAR